MSPSLLKLPSCTLPRAQAAASRLNSRQMAFCHHLMQGRYGVDAYRLAYGETRSGCPRKAAAKIKANPRVREYLEAFREEARHLEHLRHQAGMELLSRRSPREFFPQLFRK